MTGKVEGKREGYKKTEVGWIPENWDLMILGSVVKFSGGSQPPRKTFSFEPKPGYIRLIQIRDYKTDRFQTYIPKELAKKFCSKDDIMIGRYGPPIFQILKGIKGAYNVALIKAIPGIKLCKNYLWYFLKQQKLFFFIENLSQRSSGQTGVDLEKLRMYYIPLPPLSEQQKIAAILSTVDEKIDAIDTEINAIEKLKKALMRQLLTRGIGHTEFKETKIGKIPKEWEVLKLENLGELKNGINKSKEDFGQGYPFVNLMDVFGKAQVVNQSFGLVNASEKDLKDFNLLKGDVLFVRSSVKPAGVGLTSIVVEDLKNTIFSGFLIRFRSSPNILTDTYKKYCFHEAGFRQRLIVKSTVSANTNINQQSLRSLLIIVPPLSEQQKLADILSTVDEKLDILREKKETYQILKKGLMQQLLTGALRVTFPATR